MPTDAELLRRYVKDREERAMAELVERHLGMVYSAALRRTGGRTHLAEEIAQKVFTDLVRKSPALIQHPALTGWLHRSTRYAAIDALRAEIRGRQFAEALAPTSAMNPTPESPAAWERFRPVIDEALDELKDSDREAILLRYFERLGFVEIGRRLKLSENTARMRTDRALDKLRHLLGRRGITSTAAALELVLANEAFAAAPAPLAASVTASALATVPAAGVLASFLMNKITIAALSSLLAVGVTSVGWTTFVPGGSNHDELRSLRAENARLVQAMATGGDAVATVAAEFSSRASEITQVVNQRLARRADNTALGKHRNHGQASPHDAFLSHAWASDTGDVAALAKLLAFDEKGQASIRDIYASMPEPIRAQYRTPEELIAFFFIADTLLSPVPGADILEPYTVNELRPGRVALRPPGRNGGGMEFVQTVEGWKSEVPGYYPKILATRILGGETLSSLKRP